MTDICDDGTIPVQNGWWDKGNLHIINGDGEHIVLLNCEVLEYVSPDDCPDGVGYFDFKATGRIQVIK